MFQIFGAQKQKSVSTLLWFHSVTPREDENYILYFCRLAVNELKQVSSDGLSVYVMRSEIQLFLLCSFLFVSIVIHLKKLAKPLTVNYQPRCLTAFIHVTDRVG